MIILSKEQILEMHARLIEVTDTQYLVEKIMREITEHQKQKIQ